MKAGDFTHMEENDGFHSNFPISYNSESLSE